MVDTVYLLRHGHIDNGDEKRYLGRTDLGLDALGIEQAYALREAFQSIRIDAVYTSPLKRCVKTAHIISQEYRIVEALREIDMGEWENKTMAEIRSHDPESYAKRGEDLEYFTPPCGENFHAVALRAKEAFDAITCEAIHSSVIIVAHAGVNRVLLSTLLNLPIQEMMRIDQPYACVNRLTRHQGTWRYARGF
ncbi:histidine phosphatase family protein [Sulfurospirillum sp. hDNRA2]|uniref:histidine phosphatase family protein n=1 Tax=Sulfurospirillum sp. hDNRA2 TaxID=3237298 RepID=UPI0020B72FA7|nr:histidine phosphatase family protein [Sulfurospirillum sp. DNRA8]MCP3650890.1 histidine phosphatase family protein [Sulfurospirillum sp. DNRA8]MCR1809736.1 histidine phosphatase family protein [Sulfurospirillum sp. DNRA8]